MRTFVLFKRMLIAFVLLFTCSLQGIWAQQTIVIGPSAKANHPFSQFDSLLNEISAGNLNGQLTLAFESGTYTFTKALVINTAKFTAKDRLTLTSVARNRDSVTFTGNFSGGLVQLNQTHHVTFSHISIQNTNTSGMVVAFMGATDGVTFYRCNLVIPGNGTSGANSVIGKGDKQTITTPISNFKLIGNNLTGGCRNYINTAATNRIKGFRMDSNVISNTYDGCFNLYYADDISCNFNTFIPRAGTTTWPSGINLSGVTGDSVYGNLVNFSHCTQTTFGGNALCVTGDTSSKKRMLIANNVIIGYNNAAYQNKISRVAYLSAINCDFVHNSIYNLNTSKNPSDAYTTNGVFVLYINGAGSDIRLAGNQIIAYNAKNQYPIWVDSTMKKFVSDYNNYYTDDTTKLAYINGRLISGMSAFAQATGGDAHSLCHPANFVDLSKGLAMTSYVPFLMPNIGLNVDYENTTRGKTTSMGAYSVILKNNDASLTDFAQTNIAGGQSCPVYVTLTNMSLNPMTSATIQWTENNVLKTPFKWSGKLNIGEKDTILLGSVTPKAGTTFKLTAWSESPNGVKDENMANDTIGLSQYVCNGPVKGTVTVGKGKNFATLAEVLLVLNECGISGPVSVEIDNASLGQATFSGNIKGSSATNTITIKPAAGATVSIDAGAASSVILNGTSNFVFENLNIGNTTNGLVGIEINGQNENVTFRNCRIYASTSATSSSSAAVLLKNTNNATTYPVNLRFVNNDIRGGYSNMYFTYTAGTTAQMAKASVYIDSNRLSEAYYYGIYTYYFSAIKSLCHNTITNRSNSNTFYGVYSYYYAYWDKIEGNRMRLTASGSTYGFYLYYYNQYASYTSSKKAYLVNNEVIIDNKAGTKYGIHIYNPYGFWEVHHNSVYIKSAGTKYGLYLYNASTSYKINATRNIVFCDSTGTNYPLYISSTTYAPSTYGLRAYNDLYSSTNVAYAGAAKVNISDLQTTSAQDANSIKVLPIFDNINNGLQLAADSAFLCPMDASVMTDINGEKRSSNTAMGCYNAAAVGLPADAAVMAILGLNKISAATPGQVDVVIANKDANNAINKANITLLIDGVAQTTYKYLPKTALACGKTDTVNIGSFKATAGNHLFTAIVDVKGDSIHGNDTLTEKAHICAQSYSGTIVVGNSAKANCTFAQLDSLFNEFNTCGASGNITLAFESGTYTLPKALIINTAFMNGYRLTVTSIAKNRDSVTFTGSIPGGLLQLNQTHHVTFSHISIQNTNTSGMVVAFMGATDGVTFYRCNLVIPGNGTSGANSVIGKGDKQTITTPISNFKLIGNNLTGGCRNYINTTAANHIKGFRMDSNVISNTYDGCFTLYYADDVTCNFNTFIPRAGTTTWPSGLTLAYVTGDSIYGNLVNFSHCTQATFGGNALNVTGDTSCKKRMLIANNVFIGHNNAAYQNKISRVVSLNALNCDFVHNSIYNNNTSKNPTSTYATNGVFMLYLSGNGSDITCAGNQITTYNAKNQYPLYVDASVKKFTSDYNNYYSGDTMLAIYNGNAAGGGALISSVANLAKVTGGDAHSVSIAPLFVDSTVDLQLKNSGSFSMPNIGIYADILNAPRNKNTAMGAYTLSTIPAKVLEIAVTAVISPDSNSMIGLSTPLKIELTNNGTDTLTKVNLCYIFNVSKMRTYAWTGTLLPKQKAVIYPADVVPLKGKNTIKAYISKPNGVDDSNLRNDTLDVSFNATRQPGDAALHELLGLEDINPMVARPVSAVIYNKGSKSIDQATINFSINGVAQKAYNYQPKVALAQSKFDTVVIGNFTAKAGKTTFVATIAMKDDIESTNDTLKETREVYYTDFKLDEIVSPKAITGATCFGDKMPIAIAVSNKGKLDADFTANCMKISVSVSGAIKYSLDTLLAKGSLKGGESDTLQIAYIPTTAVGTYNVSISIGGDADYDATNNTAKSTFEVSRIDIPYDNNLSAQSKEIVFNATAGVQWSYIQGNGNIALAPVFGKGYLEFAGAKEKGAKASIVLNGLHIQNFKNPKLSFWYAHSAGKDQGDALVVKASTDGGATYSELGKILTAGNKAEWKRYNFDLSKFSNEKCLSIVLEATSAGANQGIDRILLTAEQDAAISLLPIDIASHTACSNDAVDIKAVIANVSDMDVELMNDTLAFKVSGATQAAGNYVYSKTLKAKTTDTLTIGKFVPASNGRYFVEVIMQSQDDNAANDTLRDSSTLVMQDIALVALEGDFAQVVKSAGDTVSLNAVMVNSGNTVIRSSSIQLKVNGNEVAKLTANNILGIGDTARQLLSYVVPFATKANPTYTLEVISAIDCDADSSNNILQRIGNVNVPDTIDIQVLDILVNDSMGKAQTKPTVRIANIGNVDAANVKLHIAVLDSAGNTLLTLSESIGQIKLNDTAEHAFTTAYSVPNYNGRYTLDAYVEAYSNDNNPDNDTLRKQFNCYLNDTRIAERNEMNWSMGQNYPNPASNITRIPFNLPQDAKVAFSVMSANGQLIYREVLSAKAGSSTLEFHVGNLSDGLYYYSMECMGERIVKKMNVSK